MRSGFFENSTSRKKIDIASLTLSSEGENTQDKDLKGKISAVTAAPDEFAKETLFSLFYWEDDVSEGLKQQIVDEESNGSVQSFKIGFQHFFSKHYFSFYRPSILLMCCHIKRGISKDSVLSYGILDALINSLGWHCVEGCSHLF